MFSGALSHVLYEKVRIPSSQACLAGWYPEQAAEQLIPGKNCDLSWPTLVKGIPIKRNLISMEERRGKIFAQDQMLCSLEQCDNSR
jgi:hypothetical protein